MLIRYPVCIFIYIDHDDIIHSCFNDCYCYYYYYCVMQCKHLHIHLYIQPSNCKIDQEIKYLYFKATCMIHMKIKESQHICYYILVSHIETRNNVVIMHISAAVNTTVGNAQHLQHGTNRTQHNVYNCHSWNAKLSTLHVLSHSIR